MSTRKGGIPGPESRTGLVRPIMSEAEFERRQSLSASAQIFESVEQGAPSAESEPPARIVASVPSSGTAPAPATSKTRTTRARAAAKPKRVQRMFALEEELDKKLWLYAIHVGKDRSEVINDLLRPVVASMVLYDSRDRRSNRQADPAVEPTDSPSE